MKDTAKIKSLTQGDKGRVSAGKAGKFLDKSSHGREVRAVSSGKFAHNTKQPPVLKGAVKEITEGGKKYVLLSSADDLQKSTEAYKTILLTAEQKAHATRVAPAGQEYVDPYLFETGHFESREEYEELMRTAVIKPRTHA